MMATPKLIQEKNGFLDEDENVDYRRIFFHAAAASIVKVLKHVLLSHILSRV
jgi:hypothetical protein